MNQTKEYYLQVTVVSEILPANYGHVSNNISSRIFSAFRGWKNTAITVEDIPTSIIQQITPPESHE